MTFTQSRSPSGKVRARCDRCGDWQTGNDRTVSAWKTSHVRKCATTAPRRRIASL